MLLIALLVVLGIIIGASRKLFGGEFFNPENIAQQVAAVGPGLLVAYFFAAVVFTAFGLPRQLVAFVSGYVFGALIGTVLSLAAAVVGCAIAFFTSRKVLTKWVKTRYPKMVMALDKAVTHDGFLKIVVLRLQPLGTNLLTNLCAGVSSMPAKVFLLASGLGYVPQMVVFALSGSGLRVGSQAQLLVSLVLFVISLILGLYLYRNHRMRLDLDGH